MVVLDTFFYGLGDIIAQIIEFMDSIGFTIGSISISLWDFVISAAVFILIFAAINRIMD